jgi:hypothetical protein
MGMNHSHNFARILSRCIVFRVKDELITATAEVAAWPIAFSPFDHHQQPTRFTRIFSLCVIKSSIAPSHPK